MNKEELIAKLAEENKIPEGDVEEIFDKKLEESEEAGLQGDAALKRAMERTFYTFKRKSQSSTEGIEGVIIGAGDRYDAVGYSRDQSIEAYQDNPQKAIKQGKVAVAVPPGEESNITGAGVEKLGEKNGWAIIAKSSLEQLMQYNFAQKGTAESDDANTEVEDDWRIYPLDDRKTYNNGGENQNYGMPQDKHSWTRRCTGIFMRDEDSDAKLGQLTLRDEQSAKNPPLGKATQFQARANEADDGSMLYINSTNDTEFNPNPELDEELPDVDTLIEKYFPQGDWRFDLDGLYEYMQDQGSGSETIVVEGDVVDMDLEANSNGTFRMVLSQLSFKGGDMVEREATVWVPEWQDEYIDFAVESRIYLIGRARLQDAYDPEKGETTSEKQEVILNAQGLYADPTAKIPREDNTEDIESGDVEFEPDEDGDDSEVEFEADGEW